MEKKGETTNLPEPIIQHIQSFLNARESARTTLLSNSWYNAWFTRPSVDLNQHNFDPESYDFEKFTAKTMRRYQDLNLNIQSFGLLIHTYTRGRKTKLLAHNLIVDAIKIGATDLEINVLYLSLPREVLESKSIVRLSLAHGEIDGDFVPCWSWLKSLSLDNVVLFGGDVFVKNISSCCPSIEDLSLSMTCCSILKLTYCWTFPYELRKLRLSRTCPYELRKLRRLFLEMVCVDNTFFSDFAFRFPCLKDLSLVNCTGYTCVEMESTSLESIVLEEPEEKVLLDMFDVPNLGKFIYSGQGSLSACIEGYSTREWEFDMTIKCHRLPEASWFLKKTRLSRKTISLFLCRRIKQEDDYEVENKNNLSLSLPKRVTVESLTIEDPSNICSASLLRFFGICCPKTITHFWLPESFWFPNWKDNNESLGMLCNLLQNTFGDKQVNMELFEETGQEWRPLLLKGLFDASKTPVNKSKVRFQLRWAHE